LEMNDMMPSSTRQNKDAYNQSLDKQFKKKS